MKALCKQTPFSLGSHLLINETARRLQAYLPGPKYSYPLLSEPSRCPQDGFQPAKLSTWILQRKGGFRHNDWDSTHSLFSSKHKNNSTIIRMSPEVTLNLNSSPQFLSLGRPRGSKGAIDLICAYLLTHLPLTQSQDAHVQREAFECPGNSSRHWGGKP